MKSSNETKQVFLARVADGILIDEATGNERSVEQVTLVFGQAQLTDVAEWIAEHKSAQQ